MKAAIARPTNNEAYLQKTSLFMRYRIAAHKALIKQVYPPSGHLKEPKETLLCKIKQINENVSAMLKTMSSIYYHHILVYHQIVVSLMFSVAQ